MNGFEFIHCSPTSELESIVFVGFALEFCDVSALQAQNKITGQSRQILFEGLPPQTQDLHAFFLARRATRTHHKISAPGWTAPQ
jgi:hypothetical protein